MKYTEFRRIIFEVGLTSLLAEPRVLHAVRCAAGCTAEIPGEKMVIVNIVIRELPHMTSCQNTQTKTELILITQNQSKLEVPQVEGSQHETSQATTQNCVTGNKNKIVKKMWTWT